MDEPQREPRFTIDAFFSTGELYITLECRDCLWVAELEVPIGIEVLNGWATEHEEGCRPG
jgi:hypothetical protein